MADADLERKVGEFQVLYPDSIPPPKPKQVYSHPVSYGQTNVGFTKTSNSVSLEEQKSTLNAFIVASAAVLGISAAEIYIGTKFEHDQVTSARVFVGVGVLGLICSGTGLGVALLIRACIFIKENYFE